MVTLANFCGQKGLSIHVTNLNLMQNMCGWTFQNLCPHAKFPVVSRNKCSISHSSFSYQDHIRYISALSMFQKTDSKIMLPLKKPHYIHEILAEFSSQKSSSPTVNTIAMQEAQLTQKSLSNQAAFCGSYSVQCIHITSLNPLWNLHEEIFCPHVKFPITWIPFEMTGFC